MTTTFKIDGFLFEIFPVKKGNFKALNELEEFLKSFLQKSLLNEK